MGRRSPKSLYSLGQVTFDEEAVYDQRDAESFIRLNAPRRAAGSGLMRPAPAVGSRP
jgi:argininosuccinate synthase